MISYGYGLVVGFGVSLLLVDHPAVGLQLLTQFAFRVRRRLMADGERCECRAKQRGCAGRGGPEAGSFAHKARPMHLLAIQVLAPEPHISPARHAPSLLVSTCNEVTAEVTAVPINYFLFLFFRDGFEALKDSRPSTAPWRSCPGMDDALCAVLFQRVDSRTRRACLPHAPSCLDASSECFDR